MRNDGLKYCICSVDKRLLTLTREEKYYHRIHHKIASLSERRIV